MPKKKPTPRKAKAKPKAKATKPPVRKKAPMFRCTGTRADGLRCTAKRRGVKKCAAHRGDNRPTPKQKAFREKMAADPTITPTDAARQAGYKNPTKVQSRLLANDGNQTAIARRRQEILKVEPAMQRELVSLLTERAFVSVDDITDAKGKFSLVKARKTGAIHHLEDLKPVIDEKGRVTGHTYKIQSRTFAVGRLANWIGLEKKSAADERTGFQAVENRAALLARENGTTIKQELEILLAIVDGLPVTTLLAIEQKYGLVKDAAMINITNKEGKNGNE